jgi:hypothetical protein
MGKIINEGMLLQLSRRIKYLWAIIFMLIIALSFSFTVISQQLIIINERLVDLESKNKTVHISVERWYDKDAKKYGYKFIDIREEEK